MEESFQFPRPDPRKRPGADKRARTRFWSVFGRVCLLCGRARLFFDAGVHRGFDAGVQSPERHAAARVLAAAIASPV